MYMCLAIVFNDGTIKALSVLQVSMFMLAFSSNSNKENSIYTDADSPFHPKFFFHDHA